MASSELDLWNEAAAEYDAFIKRGDFLREKLLNPALQGLLGDVNGKTILDAGCGQGYFTDWFLERGACATGIDGSSKLIEIAKSNYPARASNFLAGDLKEKLPLESGSFDIVLSNMVLMDFDPIDTAMGEFSRILKRGGFLIFSVLHPLISSGDLKKTWLERIKTALPHYEMKTYKNPQKRPWRIFGVSKPTTLFHRPLETYADTLEKSGFLIKNIKEPTLTAGGSYPDNFFRIWEELPLFLIIKAVKIN